MFFSIAGFEKAPTPLNNTNELKPNVSLRIYTNFDFVIKYHYKIVINLFEDY